MKRILVILLSSVLAYIIAIMSPVDGNAALILFGTINALLLLVGSTILPGWYLPEKLRYKGSSRPEISNAVLEDRELRNSLKQIMDNALDLNSALENIRNGSMESGKSAEEIALNVQDIVSQNNEQLDIVDEVAASSNSISETICKSSEYADCANREAQNATRVSIEAGNGVRKVVGTIQQIQEITGDMTEKIKALSEKSKQIDEIISVITGIASQTNLLALNAAIEAARAGEHGKGFAVVADEVRKLAEQSNNAASKVGDIIREIQEDIDSSTKSFYRVSECVSDGVTVSRAAGDLIEDIIGVFRHTAEQTQSIHELLEHTVKTSRAVLDSTEKNLAMAKATVGTTQSIAAATEEQNASIEEINSNIELITHVSEEIKQHIAAAVMDRLMYGKALELRRRVESARGTVNSLADMEALAGELGVDEADYTDARGVVCASNAQSAIGLDLYDVMMRQNSFDLKKHLFIDKKTYSVSPLIKSEQSGQLFKFLMIAGLENQNVYQVGLSYETLKKLLNK